MFFYKVILKNQPPIDVKAGSAKEARSLAAYLTKGYLTKTKQMKNIISCKKMKNF